MSYPTRGYTGAPEYWYQQYPGQQLLMSRGVGPQPLAYHANQTYAQPSGTAYYPSPLPPPPPAPPSQRRSNQFHYTSSSRPSHESNLSTPLSGTQTQTPRNTVRRSRAASVSEGQGGRQDGRDRRPTQARLEVPLHASVAPSGPTFSDHHRLNKPNRPFYKSDTDTETSLSTDTSRSGSSNNTTSSFGSLNSSGNNSQFARQSRAANHQPSHIAEPPRYRLDPRRDLDQRCRSCGEEIRSIEDVQQHIRHRNCDRSGVIICPVQKCNRINQKPFGRMDNLIQHLRQHHEWDIPKRGHS
ncbi:hypothetical protein EDC01DRAFT_633589 [Geopyxis carbonaria]|nr:hypothetical protein EDC01DRAFT_633589 [Geopyxis carbonaria]